MKTNLDKYKEDLKELIKNGEKLISSLEWELWPEDIKKQIKPADKKEYIAIFEKLPKFSDAYQIWYSEALVLLKQLLPDRLNDFVKLYEKPKTNRKDITHANYMIEDALQGLTVTRGWEKEEIVGKSAAVPRLKQQVNIIKSINKRFNSSLFDITQLVQADLFDSELDSAKELIKKGFLRGSGAIAGVIMEKHLSLVCENHTIKIKKKNPTLADYNDALKEASVYEIPTWRKIQHLSDLRNLCDHEKKKEPTVDEVEELINGVAKITKTIF